MKLRFSGFSVSIRRDRQVRRKRRTDTELIAASQHLYYEIQMLVGSMERVNLYPQGSPERNALLEAFTIHARALIDFLYPYRPRTNDVVASDFFGDESELALPAYPTMFRTVKKRVGVEIAHLSYGRQKVVVKDWEVAHIGNEMRKCFAPFLAAVPRRLLGSRWGDSFGQQLQSGGLPIIVVMTDASTPGQY